jgi:ligand-binding sensor domain-containing protein
VNRPPACTISTPIGGQTLTAGLSVQLSGGCTDPERGVIRGMKLRWSSEHQGALGDGPKLKDDLDPLFAGSDTFKLCADDPEDPTMPESCAQAMVTIVKPAAPTAAIMTVAQGPNSNSPFSNGSSIVFSGAATGQEVSIEWRDTLIGVFGAGPMTTMLGPQIGIHTVTFHVADNTGQSAQDQVTFTVLKSGVPTLVQPYTNVNSAITGAVRVLAVDSMSQVLVYGGSAPTFQRFDAAMASPTASAAMSGSAISGRINTLLIAETAGLIYIGTNNGLLVCSYAAKMQIDQTTCMTYKDGALPSNDITAIARATIAGNAYLVLGTDGGLFVASNAAGANTCLDKDGGGTCDATWGGESISGVVALGNTFWFTSTSSGLHCLDPQRAPGAMVISPDQGTSLKLNALAKDASGKLWVGSVDQGIGRFDPGGDAWTLWNKTSDPPPGLASNAVQTLATTRVNLGGIDRDIAWIGTSAGMSRFDAAIPSFMTLTADGLPDANVHVIAVLPNGNKLFGTDNGVSLYVGN